MATFEIPLTPEPQTFLIKLIDTQYRFTLAWNDAASVWMLNIDLANGDVLAHGIALVTGVDLLGQFGYLGIGGSMYVLKDGDADATPTFDNLGDACKLYFVTP